MPTYKLQYFNVRGRGELCRYLFYATGREFEDVRISQEEWPKVKPTTPFGQMPVLTVDGSKTIAQSTSIARFLAREFDLAGKDSWEQAECDQYMALVEDLIKEMVKAFLEKDEEKKVNLAGKDSWQQGQCDQHIELTGDFIKEAVKAFYEPNEEKKKELQKNMVEVVIPKFLGMFESALEKNGGKYLVGDKLTVADLAVYTVFETPLNNTPTAMDKFPKLKAQRAVIEAIPSMQTYLAGRKKTEI